MNLEISYREFIQELKSKIQTSQIKASIKVNEELLKLYWEIAKMIVAKQKEASWGDNIIADISIDLKKEFPNMKGFSKRNIFYMKQWYLFFSKVQQVVAQLEDEVQKNKLNQIFKIPWGHNIVIITKIKEQNISKTFFNRNWSFYESKIQNYKKSIEIFNPQSFKFTTDYRLLIGSEQSIYETSIRLHHIYGIPYIPASAIKGVVRSYIIIEKFESKEENAFKNSDFVKLFGSQDSEGKVIFFDAFPTSKPNIKVDIMNPHYGHYYNDRKAPTDDKNPTPINFLTVEDTTFEFFIASKESWDSLKIKDYSIEDWLKYALENHGIGAKTAVGYGYFN